MQKSAQEAQLPPLSARDVLAVNVVHLRAALGYSQEDLALEAGLHRTFIAHVERRARNISLDNVERLAIALRVQVHELLMPMDKPGMGDGAKSVALRRQRTGRSTRSRRDELAAVRQDTWP